MNRQLAALIFACSMALSACAGPTYFRHPISPPGSARYDESLVGVWTALDEDGAVFRLKIEPSDADTNEGVLVFSFMAARVDPGPTDQSGFAWFQGIGHASMIDGATYYNIRMSGSGSGIMELDESGLHPGPPESLDLFTPPEYATSEYWIAKAEVDGDGVLMVRLAQILFGMDYDDVPPDLTRFYGIRGQGWAFQIVECGSSCGHARADLSPGTLVSMIRELPEERLFGVSLGPFVRVDSTIPEFDISPEFLK
jgi:hypothetical protein